MITQVRAIDLWRSALGELEIQVPRPAFETFVKNSQGTSLEGNLLTVSVPTPFAAEWLERRAARLIENIVHRIHGVPLEVRFHVTSGTYPASGNGHIPQADAPPSNGAGSSPRLNDKYTFESFVVGPSNRLAFSAAWAVADMPGDAYNPLFIYAGVGLGKTHLLHAIGHAARKRGLQVLYVTSEQFTNQFISAIQDRTTEDFRARYRGADVLLIDDIQFIGGKEQTQEGFFHTFNDLHNSNRQIVLSSDRPPQALSLLEDRLRSRFEWGLIADIQPPDLETRMAILRAKAEALSFQADDHLIEFLARKVQRNVRELEGLLNRLAAFCSFTIATPSVETAQRALADLLSAPTRHTATPDRVIEVVCRQMGISQEALEGRRRDKKTATARQVAMYLLREELHLSFSDIGRLLGGRDHTTVTHAVGKVNYDINVDPEMRRAVLDMKETLSRPA